MLHFRAALATPVRHIPDPDGHLYEVSCHTHHWKLWKSKYSQGYLLSTAAIPPLPLSRRHHHRIVATIPLSPPSPTDRCLAIMVVVACIVARLWCHIDVVLWGGGGLHAVLECQVVGDGSCVDRVAVIKGGRSHELASSEVEAAGTCEGQGSATLGRRRNGSWAEDDGSGWQMVEVAVMGLRAAGGGILRV
ncbi:hypothetical protein EDB89DRAFT_1917226 [Lactarius sanguifluus]|nr:hypothetical protein EDB89DRAFT_1917226 [Lactarius sanguifluus]